MLDEFDLKKKFKYFDFSVFFSMILLIGIGIAAIYSATYSSGSAAHLNYQRQILWAGLGLIVFAVIVFTPMRFFLAFAYVFYGVAIASLLLVLVIGQKGSGAQRWLELGFLHFQPSEWAKLATIFVIARLFTDCRDWLRQKYIIALVFAVVLLPMLLIFKQPDLGTALVFAPFIPSLLFWGGVSPMVLFSIFVPFLTMIASFNFYTFFALMIIIVMILILSKRELWYLLVNILLNIVVGIVTPFLWHSLQEYQQKRVLTFLGLVTDPKGASYQLIQSKVAIGSGGLWGKGFLQGTQTQLRFLPEQHTDFIFSVIAEEAGFIGGMIVIVLFAIIILRGIKIAASARSQFSSLVAIGMVTLLLYHVFVNIGMVMGIMPVTGLPLPLVSYGGSSMLVSMTAVAFLINISKRRYEY